MSKIEKLIEIGEPQEKVFNAFSDSDNIRHWLPAVKQTRLVEGNRSLWSINTNDDAEHDLSAEVVERRASEHISWRVSHGGESADVVGELIETQSGGTLLRFALVTATTDATLTTHSLPLLLLGGGNLFAAERNLEHSLENFKALVEGGEDGGIPTKEHLLRTAEGTQDITSSPSQAATITTAAAVATAPLILETPFVNTTSHHESVESEATIIRPSSRLPASGNTQSAVLPGFMPERQHPPVPEVTSRRRPSPASASLILLVLLIVSAIVALWLWQRSRDSQADDAAQLTAGASDSETAATSVATAPAASSSPKTVATVAPLSKNGSRDLNADGFDTTVSSNAGTSSLRSLDAERTTLRTNLNTWVAATNDANLDAQISFYAPVLERYYLRTDFPRAAVREDKEKLVKRARLSGVNVDDLEITFSPDGQTATMRFRKEYGFMGSAKRDAVLQELRWRKTKDGWRIISERDLRVLR